MRFRDFALVVGLVLAAGCGPTKGLEHVGEGSTSGSTGTPPSDLCTACEDDTDCDHASICTQGGFCSPTCSADADCASGTRCVDGDAGVRFCVPASGSCQGSGSTSSTGSTGSTGTSTSSGSTSGSSSSGSSSGSTSGTTGFSVGPHGGTVDLMRFGISGDTRPPACGDTANYPTPIITSIAKLEKAAGAQFALDLGDHMFVCDNDAHAARKQMSLYMGAVDHFDHPWFMTEGNHECMGAGSGHCPTGSTNVNFQAFLHALAPVSATPYYSVDVQTSLGLATFVFIADNSWDTAQEHWLKHTLTAADSGAKYTIIAKHHPEGDRQIASNATIMSIIRAHKFALLLTGHAHYYAHQAADSGRDLILGIGGAPLTNGASFHGYGIVEQRPNGRLRVSIYDVHTNTLQDRWSVGPNF